MTTPLGSQPDDYGCDALLAGLSPDFLALCGPEITVDTVTKTTCELLRLGLFDGDPNPKFFGEIMPQSEMIQITPQQVAPGAH